MKLLVLLAAWAGDSSQNTINWLNWYKNILTREFSRDDVFLAISNQSDRIVHKELSIPNLIGTGTVTADLHVNSDASQYQLCLRELGTSLKDYDYVFFMHTKGISYDFERFGSWRDGVEHTIFSRLVFERTVEANKTLLVAERGHMIQSHASILQCKALGETMEIKAPVFHYAAATTIFYAPAEFVSHMTRTLPSRYLNENLITIGENRFFFEGAVPSLITMIGAEPIFVGGSELHAGLSSEVSFDAYPKHNSAIVRREFGRRLQHGTEYQQVPIPYVFGKAEDINKISIAFGL